MIELRLRGKTFENTLYKVHLKDENQNVISTYSAVPRQAQFNPGQVILGGGIDKYVCVFQPSFFLCSERSAGVRQLFEVFLWDKDSHTIR